MESEVIAALIASPVAVVAAAAAYAAGKAQGRGTVDAVRRASQRDTYAQLLTALYAFLRAENELANGALSATPPEERMRRFAGTYEHVEEAMSVVMLEGPPHLAEHTVLIRTQAIALLDWHNRVGGVRNGSQSELKALMVIFSKEASAYLNTGRVPTGLRSLWNRSRTQIW
ncbi:hypothetical protein [[Kitasatospora] papulosa]|uniref:hypothetical protein n=1 Tax=[Kitasatospora] papulosa TaxID=1464011 RepID=UPI003715E3E1